MSEYKIDIHGGKSIELAIEKPGELIYEGKKLNYDSSKISEGRYHFILNHKSYQIEVVEMNAKTKEFSLLVNNKKVDLKVEDRFDLLLHQLGMDSLSNVVISNLKAPMPGLVLSIPVEVGQALKKDEPLVVLEAMKMENVLKSPADVVIKAISVAKGQAVEKNEILIEFEI